MTKYLFSLLVACLVFAGCALQVPSTPSSSAVTKEPISVVATFYPWAYFLQQVGGNRVQVTSIVANGMEPHDFEPGLADVATIRAARIFLYNGAGLDQWADKIVSQLDNDTVLPLRAADLTPLLDAVESGHGHSDDQHHEQDALHEAGFDPHFWLDPVAVRSVVDRIEQALLTVDPDQGELYRSNANRLRADLDALDAAYRVGLQACRVRTAVTGHAAFAYLAQRYAFTQLPVSGLSPENEPSLARLREIAEAIRSNGIRFVFLETLASPKVSETLARETGASTLVFNPLEGLTAEEQAQGKDYFSVMRDNLENLRKGMECT